MLLADITDRAGLTQVMHAYGEFFKGFHLGMHRPDISSNMKKRLGSSIWKILIHRRISFLNLMTATTPVRYCVLRWLARQVSQVQLSGMNTQISYGGYKCC